MYKTEMIPTSRLRESLTPHLCFELAILYKQKILNSLVGLVSFLVGTRQHFILQGSLVWRI
jgi:hypothetical protein